MSRGGQSLLAQREFLRLPADQPPVLLVVIDTEEEFAWGQGFRRENDTVAAMRGIPRFQRLFDEFGVRPTYVVDHPIATQPDGYAALKEFHDAGTAVIGAHLHPWVNPPHDEEPSDRLSYPGNLGRELEARKLSSLTAAIEETFGHRPTIYKAGRYGIGPHTESILEELGYEIDLSVNPGVEYGADGGPDFLAFPPEPYWFGRTQTLLEIPVTCAFVGPLARWGGALTRWTDRSWARTLRLRGVLARSGLLSRLGVSPEGFEVEHHRRVTRALLRQGVRVISLAFHSPSTCPGYTSYVQSEAELEAFHDRIRRYFEYFLGELGGVATTPHGLRDRLLAAPSGTVAVENG